MHIIDLHRRSVEEWLTRVTGVRDGQWAAPTPCEDWDVRELVNHVVGEDLWTVPLMDGATIAEVGDRFEGDVLGDDPAGAAAASGNPATAAVVAGVEAGRTVHLSFGDTPAEEYAYQLAADHLIHGWDLAAAVGGDRRFDAELVNAIAAWFAQREDLYRAGGAIGPRPEGGDLDDPQARLLAAFGRDADWSPG